MDYDYQQRCTNCGYWENDPKPTPWCEAIGMYNGCNLQLDIRDKPTTRFERVLSSSMKLGEPNREDATRSRDIPNP